MAAQGWNPTRQTQHPTLFILIITVHVGIINLVITIITKKIFDQHNPHQFVYKPPHMIIIIIDMIITVFIILIDMSTTFCLRRPNPLLLVIMIKLMINNSSNVDDEPELAEGRLVCVPDHLFGSHLNHYHPDDPFSLSSCLDHTFIIIIHIIFLAALAALYLP